MTYEPVAAIEVSAWGRVVGYIAFDESIRAYAFESRSRIRRCFPTRIAGISPALMSR